MEQLVATFLTDRRAERLFKPTPRGGLSILPFVAVLRFSTHRVYVQRISWGLR